MSERYSLPVLPLRDTVVYPGVAVPISAGRPGTIEAVQRALDGDRRLFAVAQRENVDEPSPEILYTVGTVVRILQTHRVRGGVQLLVQGEARAQAMSFEREGEEMLVARLVEMHRQPPSNTSDPAFQALDRELRERAAELGTRRGVPTEALNQLIHGVEEPGAFADLVAFYLDLPTAEKQRLLETLDDEERMRRALVAVQRELARLAAQEEIQSKVQEELGERQREMFLREQLKAIQHELGDEDERSEVEELRQRLEAIDLPEAARSEVNRELKRLERTPPQAAEYQVIRTFLEWVCELPWSLRTEDKIDLARAERILHEDHYGLEDVKDRVLEFLAVRKLQIERAPPDGGAEEAEEGAGEGAQGRTGEPAAAAAAGESAAEAAADAENERAGDAGAGADEGAGGAGPPAGEEAVARRKIGRGPILLFAGPPGTGKTSIAQSIARALGRKYVRISLGGARDEADIRGHRRTYVGAMPGRIIQGMRQAGSKNPVFLLDEVDKLGVSFQGDPSAALLEVLDPEQNQNFVDHYLGIAFDLSEVLFIGTANYIDRIPAPLLDRMETVEFVGYIEQEKLEIAKRYLLARLRKEAGVTDDEVVIEDNAIRTVINEYTREAGVRQLERELGKMVRKIARRIAAGEVERVTLTPEVARELLGRARVHPEKMMGEDVLGVATGMYYTPNGGDIMFVEASVMPGAGDLVLTGQLGDVMKESGRAALTYAKTHHARLGIPEERLKEIEVHIHVPAGAVPKDGPSAGITMATALISALSGRAVRHDVAMTGELTLTGRVLPIGGVKEKVLGAYRAGLREVILPAENDAYLEELPREVRDELTIHLVTDLDAVLRVAARAVATERAEPAADEKPARVAAGA